MMVNETLQVIKSNLGEIISVLGILGFALEVSPIKISPLDWIGKRLNKGIRAEIKEVKDFAIATAKISDERRMKDLRRRILTFADGISKGIGYSEQSYNDVLEAYDEYEELIIKHDFKNGKILIAIDIIRQSYRMKKESDSFLK